MPVDFKSHRSVKSATMPGVTFVFRVMTEGVRTRLNMALADDLAKLRIVRAKLDSLDVPRQDDGGIDESAALSPETKAEVLNIIDEIDCIRRTAIDPAYFRECFSHTSGLTIDDRTPLDADDLLENGPEALYREIVSYIRADMELTLEERANLESPTTSAAPVDGRTSSTTAAVASPADSTSHATADDSFQQT